MPKVISDELHSDILDLLEKSLDNVENGKAKEHLKEIHAKLKICPSWQTGRTYANPAKAC